MKRLIIIGVVLLLFAAGVSATDTRVMTMGDNNLIMLDDANIWLFPSRIFEYPNLAVGEFGNLYGYNTDDFAQFGIHWKFGTDNPIVLGTYFTKLPAAVPDDFLGAALVPFDFGLLDNRRLTLIYGNALGNFNLGTKFDFYHSSWEDNETLPAVDQSKEAFNYYDFNFGATSQSGDWDVSLDIAFGSWTDEDAAGQTETEPDGFMDFSVTGRWFMPSPDYTFVPHLGFVYGKRGIKDNVVNDGDPASLDLTDKYTLTGFDVGIGVNYTPSASVLAVLDFGFTYLKWKDELDVQIPAPPATSELTLTNTVLPYFKIGLDADVFKWMDIRMGATSYWNREKFEDKGLNNENSFNWAENETYLGFGFHWKRLHVDTYTDPELFLQGFDFISGNGDVDMNFRISAVYEMM
ncbi:MAG: hypothetical protein JSW34_10525 [Candidatus Zixiibacteriota bacterium]|nr:MAG: hypothetical protein JSW34_10525 [candidate division Zixibacteria bacterium]